MRDLTKYRLEKAQERLEESKDTIREGTLRNFGYQFLLRDIQCGACAFGGERN